MSSIENTYYPQPLTVTLPGHIYPCVTHGDITNVTIPTTTHTINSTVNPVKTIDTFLLSAMLRKIEKRLDRIEEQLLLIFETDGQTKNLS